MVLGLNLIPGFVDHGHIVCPVCTEQWARGCAGYLRPGCWRIPATPAQAAAAVTQQAEMMAHERELAAVRIAKLKART